MKISRNINKSDQKLILFVLFSIILFLYWLFPNHRVHAADFIVSTAAELNQAIIAANGNTEADTITLSANITLADTLTTVTSIITIEGDGYTIDINQQDRMIDVTGNLTINNITIKNGNNVGSDGGGAILNNYGGLLTINGSNFVNNSSIADGGSIHNSGILTVTNCTFSNNLSENHGGAIYNDDGEITINQSSFLTNTSSIGGGAIYSLGNNAYIAIHNSNIKSNFVTGINSNGGGVVNEGVMSIDNSTFENNSAENNDGGGIFNFKSLIITNSSFLNNIARRGGGAYNQSDFDFILENSTFSGNSADYGGGFHSHRNTNNILINNTIYNNTANIDGGGIRNNGTLTLTHNLVSGNSAPLGAEFYHATLYGAVTIANDFNLFGHSGLTDEQAYNDFLPGASDFNATSNTYPSTGQNVPITKILNTTLAQNGGSTLTHALVTGSPAVDLVTDTLSACPLTDQRGIERPWPLDGFCDCGAYELQYLNLNIISEHGIVERYPDLQTIQLGDVITLTAIPDPHWSFIDWSGDITSLDNPLKITMTEDITITASYLQLAYNLEVNVVGNGVVDIYPESSYGDGYYDPGSSVTLTAKSDPGWTFAGWSGDTNGLSNQIEITINADTLITATFTQDEYILNISHDHGSIERIPDKNTYHYGDEVILTAIADQGWHFKGWSGDLTSNENPIVVTITEDMDIIALFEENIIFLPLISR